MLGNVHECKTTKSVWKTICGLHERCYLTVNFLLDDFFTMLRCKCLKVILTCAHRDFQPASALKPVKAGIDYEEMNIATQDCLSDRFDPLISVRDALGDESTLTFELLQKSPTSVRATKSTLCGKFSS